MASVSAHLTVFSLLDKLMEGNKLIFCIFFNIHYISQTFTYILI